MTMWIKQIPIDNVNLQFLLVFLEDGDWLEFQGEQDFFRGRGKPKEPQGPQETLLRFFSLFLTIILSNMGARLKETAWPKWVE